MIDAVWQKLDKDRRATLYLSIIIQRSWIVRNWSLQFALALQGLGILWAMLIGKQNEMGSITIVGCNV